MYDMRFPGEDTSALTLQQLRGREGTRERKLYAHHSQRTGVTWTKRHYKPGDSFAAGDDVNRLLSAANSALYGICHAVIAGIWASPALGFVHTGSALSFVLDIADLYKAEFTIPLSFDLAAQGLTSERDARTALRDAAVRGTLLHQSHLPATSTSIPMPTHTSPVTSNFSLHTSHWDRRVRPGPAVLEPVARRNPQGRSP